MKQRMVSLVGPPGAGKTRLAVQLASEVARRFHDGVWFVELAPLSDPAMMSRLVANAVGISEETGADPVDQLLKWLGSKRLLLVLDNCEQVVEEAARLSNQLLRGCPGLALLVTSRERLAVAGELVWPVQPMETPWPGRSYLPSELVEVESAMLFVDRAWRARADGRRIGLGPTGSTEAAEHGDCALDADVGIALEVLAWMNRKVNVAHLAAPVLQGLTVLLRP